LHDALNALFGLFNITVSCQLAANENGKYFAQYLTSYITKLDISCKKLILLLILPFHSWPCHPKWLPFDGQLDIVRGASGQLPRPVARQGHGSIDDRLLCTVYLALRRPVVCGSVQVRREGKGGTMEAMGVQWAVPWPLLLEICWQLVGMRGAKDA